MQLEREVTVMVRDEPMEDSQRPLCWAHSANLSGRWHRLSDHLASVARTAQHFACTAQWASEAHLVGFLHDIGKYGERFQARLAGQESGIDHWSLGAWIALRDHKAIAAALACEGHHVGLQRGDPQSLRRLLPENLAANHPLHLTLSEPDPDVLLARAAADSLTFSTPAQPAVPSWSAAVAGMLDVRMLFSCLVDADFLDTEAHFSGDAQGKQFRPEGPKLDPLVALDALNRFLDHRIRGAALADPRVLAAREALWQATGSAAQAAPGLFALTAPTGSGKTLAMLRFALEHAARNQLHRIVLAVPFLTVIEQTARIYRDVFAGFPEHFILEHHSLAGLGEESERRDAEGAQERQRRLLAENWDASIVLTTNVQSVCRALRIPHRIRLSRRRPYLRIARPIGRARIETNVSAMSRMSRALASPGQFAHSRSKPNRARRP